MRMKWTVGFILFGHCCGRDALGTIPPGTADPGREHQDCPGEEPETPFSRWKESWVLNSDVSRRITNFLPLWTGQYGYTRYSTPVTVGAITGRRSLGALRVGMSYNFNTTLNQPLLYWRVEPSQLSSREIGCRSLERECGDGQTGPRPSGEGRVL